VLRGSALVSGPDGPAPRSGRAAGTLPYAARAHFGKAAVPVTVICQGRFRRVALASAVCALVVTGTGLTGCSGDPDAGTNGVGRLAADQIQSRTRTAARAADTVHVSGSVVSNGRTYTLDMRLKPQGGTGTVASKGASFGLLRVGKKLYLKAGSAFWNRAGGGGGGSEGGTRAAGKLDGTYVKVPQGDPSYRRFSGFTDKDVLLSALLALHGTLATDGHHDRNGTPAIRITGDHGSGGTLDVSLKGRPYPLRLARAGGAGTLSFSEWDRDFPLSEPDPGDTVDYGKQLPTS
jgi:hypothetical protein